MAVASLTASSSVGASVVLTAGPFDYTIVPDDPAITAIHGHCIPAPDTTSLATIPIVRLPSSKDDCKGGGWSSLTDATGKTFQLQGLCEQFVLGPA